VTSEVHQRGPLFRRQRDNPGHSGTEIVMAYRRHASPLFARWDAINKRFNVLDRKTLEPTGDQITNAGGWVSGKA
jgi:hypothetical protein